MAGTVPAEPIVILVQELSSRYLSEQTAVFFSLERIRNIRNRLLVLIFQERVRKIKTKKVHPRKSVAVMSKYLSSVQAVEKKSQKSK